MDLPRRESLDRLAAMITRAGGISDEEVERIGSSPFINARLRAGIEVERQRQAGQGSGLLANVLVAWRAISFLVVVTLVAVVMFWLSKPNASANLSPPPGGSVDNIARVVTGGTCALSSTAECAISTEEVLATLFADKDGEGPK